MNSPSNEKDENNDQNPIPMPLANAVNVVDSHKNDIEALRPASIQTKPVKVPRSQRRGLFGRFTILAEVENPKEYPRSVKWFITFVIAMAAIAAPIGSTLIFPAIPGITKEFNTDATVTNLSVALYMLAMAIFPLWWSSFSETSGRRTIYLVSFTLFLLWSILGAVSTNIGMFVVMRILSGGASASVQAVGSGTIADIWEPRERGQAMGFFYLGPLMGPLLGPIIGGLLDQKLGWRSTQWFLAIYAGGLLVFLFFALPETLKVLKPIIETPHTETTDSAQPELSRVRSRRSVQRKTQNGVKIIKRIFIDPLKILLYLRFPAVIITVYYASIAFGSLYLLNVSMETTFSRPPYNFSSIQLGLAYIPSSVGYLAASVFAGRWSDRIMAREAKPDGNGDLVYKPEDRMRENAWIAAFLYPSALIWYGWTSEKHLFWAIPLAANLFFGIGCMIIFGMATTMLTEFMPRKASAGVAANNFIRNTFACVAAVAAGPLIGVIGNGWLFTGVGTIAMASSSVIWAMRKFGLKWRSRMDRELK